MAGFWTRLFGRKKAADDFSRAAATDKTKKVDGPPATGERVRRISDAEMSGPRVAEGADEVPYPPGHRIGGRHEVVEVLGGVGKTGMGIVYVCHRYGDDGLFVLKTFQERFLRESSVREAFQREALLNVRLCWHPHTVTANTVIILDGRPFIDMLYVPPDSQGRRTLADHLASLPAGQTLPPQDACRLAIETCHGMEHAVALGVTPHRDLKPANIFLSHGSLAQVGDFGLARAVHADLPAWDPKHRSLEGTGSIMSVRTARGVRVVGTPPWMSPEQFDGRADQRSDIYAMGIMLFQMATGRLPYQGRNWERAHRTEPVPPFDSPLAPIARRALAKDPAKRYQTFSEMRQELEATYRRLAGEAFPSLAQTLHAMGMMRNCLGGWSEEGKGIDCLVNLATAYHNLGQDAEAEPLLRRALEMDVESAKVHATLGLVRRRLGDVEGSLAHFQLAARHSPRDPLLLHNTATTLMQASRYKEALPLLDRALALDDALPGIWADEALCLERLGAYGRAMPLVERALHQMPRDPKAWLLKAQILVGMKDRPRALEAVEQAKRYAATHDVAQLCRHVETEAAALSPPAGQRPCKPARGVRLEFPYTIPLSRDRHEQLSSLFCDLRRPSKRITSAQLAAAVRGDADAPSWAQDLQFEAQIEELLGSDVAWVCPDCDGIIAFFDCPPGEDRNHFTEDLMLVYSRDGVNCPDCGTREGCFLNPEYLRYGKAVTRQTLADWADRSLGEH